MNHSAWVSSRSNAPQESDALKVSSSAKRSTPMLASRVFECVRRSILPLPVSLRDNERRYIDHSRREAEERKAPDKRRNRRRGRLIFIRGMVGVLLKRYDDYRSSLLNSNESETPGLDYCESFCTRLNSECDRTFHRVVID